MIRSIAKFCLPALIIAIAGGLTLKDADAGIGYYYSAPSYYIAPPVYGPSSFNYGYYSGPAYNGGYSPFGTSYYPGGVYNYGYPSYGYYSPYRYYGYRPQRFGVGIGVRLFR